MLLCNYLDVEIGMQCISISVQQQIAGEIAMWGDIDYFCELFALSVNNSSFAGGEMIKVIDVYEDI